MGCNCGKNTTTQRQTLPEFTSAGCPNVPTHDLFTSYSDAEKQIIAEQLGFLADTINIQNNPDEEDLTNIAGGTFPILKFKDKAYDPDNFSGYGRVFLRKHLVDITDVNDSNYSTKTINTLTQDMFESESGCPLVNTIFIVQYDYDLNGQCIELPDESVLLILGGSIKNGTIILHNNSIINNFLNFEEVFEGVTFKNNFKTGTTRLIDNILYYFEGTKWLPLAVEGSRTCNTEYVFYYGTANTYWEIDTSDNIKAFKSDIEYIKPVRFTVEKLTLSDRNTPIIDSNAKEKATPVVGTESANNTLGDISSNIGHTTVPDTPISVTLNQKCYWIVPALDGYDVSVYTNGILNTDFKLVTTKIIKSVTYNVYELAQTDISKFDSQVIYIKQ